METQITLVDGSIARVIDTKLFKHLRSENYNFIFNKKNGSFIRFGNTIESDRDLKLGLPEILDIEISTACNGVNNKVCSFCYKANTPKGKHMTFDTFKQVLDKMPATLCQVALGIGDLPNRIDSNSTIGNPDMWDMMSYCRDKQIIPNLTINGDGLTEEIADKLIKYVGAIAVSEYNKDVTYNAVKLLTDKGLKQTNIHKFLSTETFESAMQLMQDYKTDDRLKNLNAFVFLSLKTKGRAEKGFTQLAQEKFNELVDYAFKNNIPIGFDSCSSFKFKKSILNETNFETIWDSADPCESTIYSTYVDVDGYYAPCSFSVNTHDDWKTGLSVLECNDFLTDIWFSDKVKSWREKFIFNRDNEIACPFYTI